MWAYSGGLLQIYGLWAGTCHSQSEQIPCLLESLYEGYFCRRQALAFLHMQIQIGNTPGQGQHVHQDNGPYTDMYVKFLTPAERTITYVAYQTTAAEHRTWVPTAVQQDSQI